jgi:molybdenum cofactor cytidylyltransferase
LNLQGIGAVILAAGESSRLGQSKQLLQFRGKTLVQRIVEAASAAECSPIVVVLGSEAAAIKAELKNSPATLVENAEWRSGIGSSICAGVRRLIDQAPDQEAILLLLCDQPFVDDLTIRRLIGTYRQTGKPIIASAYAGTVGVPALFAQSCFPELLALGGDAGAKTIILRDPQRVAACPFPLGAVDLDTAADYRNLLEDSSRAGG